MRVTAPRLAETIPHFHHTRKRFQALQKAVENDHEVGLSEAAGTVPAASVIGY